MGYIDKRFHFYSTTKSFEDHLKQGFIDPDSICFLGETHEIYTQGTVFGLNTKDFTTIQQIVLDHVDIINNILGIAGPSVDTDKIDNLSKIIQFLQGFNTEDDLKNTIEILRDSTDGLYESIMSYVTERINNIERTVYDVTNLVNELKSKQDAVLQEVLRLQTIVDSIGAITEQQLDTVLI